MTERHAVGRIFFLAETVSDCANLRNFHSDFGGKGIDRARNFPVAADDVSRHGGRRIYRGRQNFYIPQKAVQESRFAAAEAAAQRDDFFPDELIEKQEVIKFAVDILKLKIEFGEIWRRVFLQRRGDFLLDDFFQVRHVERQIIFADGGRNDSFEQIGFKLFQVIHSH